MDHLEILLIVNSQENDQSESFQMMAKMFEMMVKIFFKFLWPIGSIFFFFYKKFQRNVSKPGLWGLRFFSWLILNIVHNRTLIKMICLCNYKLVQDLPHLYEFLNYATKSTGNQWTVTRKVTQNMFDSFILYNTGNQFHCKMWY